MPWSPPTVALEIIAAARKQDDWHARGWLKFKYGPAKFVGLGIWKDTARWALDTAEIRLQQAARVGSC